MVIHTKKQVKNAVMFLGGLITLSAVCTSYGMESSFVFVEPHSLGKNPPSGDPSTFLRQAQDKLRKLAGNEIRRIIQEDVSDSSFKSQCIHSDVREFMVIPRATENLKSDGSLKIRIKKGLPIINFVFGDQEAQTFDLICDECRAQLLGDGLIYERDSNGNSPLFVAAREGHVGIFTRLLAACCRDKKISTDKIFHPNHNNETLLHCAVQGGDMEIVEFLLEKIKEMQLSQVATVAPGDMSLDINAQNLDGNTPLHIAVQNGWWGLYELLQKSGADVYALNRQNESPLELKNKYLMHGQAAPLIE